MTHIADVLEKVPPGLRLQKFVVARCLGPGGLYNLGNVIGLSAGLGLQLAHAGGQSVSQMVLSYFTGSPQALCMTVATLIFMLSGEAYHRAWDNGSVPSQRLIWWGDFLSGIGALWLGAALFLLGHPWLAATAGLLHAAGKFGSALYKQHAGTAFNWPVLFRRLVLASRVPAIAASGFEFGVAAARGVPLAILAPATLLGCYLLWAQADILLMEQ